MGRECYHCKHCVEEGEAHDCWTTTEAALTHDLSEDLQAAWERLRESAVEFGEQRIDASHRSIHDVLAVKVPPRKAKATRRRPPAAKKARRR